jgi:hypothetical protein
MHRIPQPRVREPPDRCRKLVHLNCFAARVQTELADPVAGAAMYVHLLRLETEARTDAEGGVVDDQLTHTVEMSDEVIDEFDELLERLRAPDVRKIVEESPSAFLERRQRDALPVRMSIAVRESDECGVRDSVFICWSGSEVGEFALAVGASPLDVVVDECLEASGGGRGPCSSGHV